MQPQGIAATMVSMAEPELNILYEQGPCLVVCKPPGLLTQAPPGIDSLESRIKSLYLQRRGTPGKVYLGVPHRIDRPASGAMVFARNVRAARRLSQQFACQEVRKVYWACVSGQVEPAEGTWQDYLRKVPNVASAEVVDGSHAEGRLSVLRYRVLALASWGAWLEIELQTGRTHQIRVQASSRGHPLLGDAQYGSSVSFGPRQDDKRLRAIALHSRSLGFRHPKTREPVSVTAPLPEAWASLGLPLGEV